MLNFQDLWDIILSVKKLRFFRCGNYSLPLGAKTYIMGILNVTPDSFSDRGKYFSASSAVRRAEQMIEVGCDIIDIGAVSTRPFASYVSPAEEWDRLKNIVPEIKSRYTLPLSVDTYDVGTAEKCLSLGADIINDVSGVFSADMAALIKKYGAGWILMHGGVNINKPEDYVDYKGGILNCVNIFFDDMLKKTKEQGIMPENICLDPGFGFAKNTEQNVELVKNFSKLKTGSSALLCALSNKRFIGEISMCASVDDRIAGTLAANLLCAERGADILRVHNVACHKKALRALDTIIKN